MSTIERVTEEDVAVLPAPAVSPAEADALAPAGAPATQGTGTTTVPREQYTAQPPDSLVQTEGGIVPMDSSVQTGEGVVPTPHIPPANTLHAAGAAAVHPGVVEPPQLAHIDDEPGQIGGQGGHGESPASASPADALGTSGDADAPPSPADGSGDDGGDGPNEAHEASDDDDRRQPLIGKKEVLATLEEIGDADDPIVDPMVYEEPLSSPIYERVDEAKEQVCGRLSWRTEGDKSEQDKAAAQIGIAVLEEATLTAHQQNGYQISPFDQPPSYSSWDPPTPPTVGEVTAEVENIYERTNAPVETEEELRPLDSPEVAAKLEAVREAAIAADAARVRYLRRNNAGNHTLYYGGALPELNRRIEELNVGILDFSSGNLPPGMEAPVRMSYGNERAVKAHGEDDERARRWTDRTNIAWNDFSQREGLASRKNDFVSRPARGVRTLNDHESILYEALNPAGAPPEIRGLFKHAIRETFTAAGYRSSMIPVNPDVPLPNFDDLKRTYLELADERLRRLGNHVPEGIRNAMRRQYESLIENAGNDL